jgi:hypothetical protein
LKTLAQHSSGNKADCGFAAADAHSADQALILVQLDKTHSLIGPKNLTTILRAVLGCHVFDSVLLF